MGNQTLENNNEALLKRKTCFFINRMDTNGGHSYFNSAIRTKLNAYFTNVNHRNVK